MESLNGLHWAIGFSYFAELIILLGIAKWTYDKIARFNVTEQMTQKDNLAFMISYAGYFLGISIFLFAILSGDSQHLYQILETELNANKPDALMHFYAVQVSDFIVYGLMGISLLLLSRLILDKFVLYAFSIHKELIEDHNAGTGAVLFGAYVSSGIILAAAMIGQESALLSPILYFLLGQIFLVLFAKLYSFFLPFNIHEQIEKDNTAVGTAFGAILIALSLLIFKALSHEHEDYVALLIDLGTYMGIAFVLFPAARILLDKIIFVKLNITHELLEDRNTGIGLLEGLVAILLAASIYFCF